ncbi:N-alpha-acetyltransferase 80 isoform X2 [Diabrotica virgifera virgifera]|nr:N-alpha-acetyltransferase 80 isoform X2 [Diabrotica virgifera virgifera]
MNLEVVSVHRHPEYLMDCCKLLNQEWKRSDTARLHSLQQSCDTLPTSLVLLKDKLAIGHLKLSIIPSIRTACFLESVVIEKSLRGKGYGSILMKEAETFCRSLGLDMIYLSTKGQEQFYQKLGYSQCAPVSIYGSFVPKLSEVPKNIKNSNLKLTSTLTNEIKNSSLPRLVTPLAPPPPPPLPSINSITKTIATYMNKEL